MDDNIYESALGFKPQKVIFLNKYLPYEQSIYDEIKDSISQIRYNLGKAVVQKDIRHGFLYWLNQLRRHIRLYGYCFSKDDHLFFINLLIDIGTNQEQEFFVCGRCFDLLYFLLKKKELISPSDLVIQWKPLYDYYANVILSSGRKSGAFFISSGMTYSFKLAVKLMRNYFPHSATGEILEQFRPMFCPEDTAINKAFAAFELFMPTYGYVEPPPYNLWLDELLDLWTSFDCVLSWQTNLFSLISRLSWDNMGEISWKNHLSLIFNRIIRYFSLPVTYKKVGSQLDTNLEISAITVFIVSNMQDPEMKLNIKDLLLILYSYFHPSNNGEWSHSIQRFIQQLTNYFTDRVYIERYRPSSWLRTVPEEKQLTDEDITFFIELIIPIVKLMTFSKSGCFEASAIYYKLSLLGPHLVIPHLLSQLESAFETLIEPHRLIASIHCTVKVARPIVLGGQIVVGGTKLYPEGQAMVMPLLFQSLPGIDPNDFQKCMVTFQFIGTFSFLIPIENFSAMAEYNTNLSELEQSICLQSADLQDFVLQFLEKCFNLIQSCSLAPGHHHDKDSSVMNIEENLFEAGLSSAFKAILIQASPAIFEAAIEHLWNFTKSNCLEIKVSGRLLAVMCRVAAKVNTEKTLKLFLPPICKLLLCLTDNQSVREQENADDEILFNLLILSELVDGNGNDVNEYVPIITRVLENTIHLKCMVAQKMASSILQCLLHSLSSTTFTDAGLVSKAAEEKHTNLLDIWGKHVPIDELQITWIEPDEKRRESVHFLLHKFMIPELDIIRKITQGDKSYSRECFHQSLIIIRDALWSGRFLPLWDEEIYPLLDMTVDMRSNSIRLATKEMEVQFDSPNYPSNVRLAIANTIIALVDFMLENGSDDTKAFNYILTIYYNLTFFFGIRKNDHDSIVKGLYNLKQSLRMMEKKKNMRPVLMTRVKLQHEKRIMAKNEGIFTHTHKRILFSLWEMAISDYSEVRRKSQLTLGKYLMEFHHSYKLILPKIIEVLQKDPVEHHKAFKGTLFTMHNVKNCPLFVKRDWNILYQLWPAIVSARYSEKTSIIKLYDTMLYYLRLQFETFNIQFCCNEKAERTAKNFLISVNSVGWEISDERKNTVAEQDKSNLDIYRCFVIKLANTVNTGNLHFRRVQLALTMLRIIIRQDTTFPSLGVDAIVNNLISDNIDLRRISLYAMPHILNSQKRKNKKITINPREVDSKHALPSKTQSLKTVHGDSRPDNRWMQYDKNSINMDKEKWENGIFVHKTYQGWYCWPKTIEVYAPYSQQPQFNRDPSQFTEGEKSIYNFFGNKCKADRLIDYLSIEKDKENDKYEMLNSTLFKRLFRNFGDIYLPNFHGHLTRLAKSTTESHQRCAAEILAGMMRGMKLWPYEMSMKILDIAVDTVTIAFSKVMNETLPDWGICLNTIGRDRDPNKLAKLIEMTLEKPLIREETGAFLVSSRLFLVQKLLEQQQWRIANCTHEVLDELKLHLSNPYKSIRDRISLFLYRLLMRGDSTIEDPTLCLHPSQSEFLEFVLPQLSILIQGSGTRRSSVVSFYRPNGDSTSEGALPMKIHDQLTLSENLIKAVSQCDRNIDNIIQKTDSIISDISLQKLSPERNLAEVEMQSHESLVSNSGCGFLPDESEERKTAFRLMNTMCKYLMWAATYGTYSPWLFKFLPYLCHLEETDSDEELRNNCHSTLVSLTKFVVPSAKECAYIIGILKDIIMNKGNWWRARCSGLDVLQVFIFNNYFWIVSEEGGCENLRSLIWEITFDAIQDIRTEIRNAANKLLSGCFHYQLFSNTSETLNIFKSMLKNNKLSKRKDTFNWSPDKIVSRHAGILGLCAYVNAHPYNVIEDMPEILVILTHCVHDPQPLSTDAKQALSNFKRTHHDNWNEHKKMFSTEQLSDLNEVLVSSSYYS